MNNNNFDLNLLKTFKALMQELNLTRAALKLGLSQPALSHALKRLRHEFKDPLFVRSQFGMTPTPLAKNLFDQLIKTMDSIDQFYCQSKLKSLADYDETITIAATDYLENVVIKNFGQTFIKNVPSSKIVTRNMNGAFPKQALENGEVDLAIAGFFKNLPAGFYQQGLFEDKFVCLTSANNFLVRSKLTLKAYLNCPHILTTLNGDLDSIVDNQLKKMGKSRNVPIALSNFISPYTFLENSNLVLTCLSKLADEIAPYFKLRRFQPPIDLPTVKISQVWHARTHQDPLRSWVRAQIKQLF